MKEPFSKRDVRRHLQSKWKDLIHAVDNTPQYVLNSTIKSKKKESGNLSNREKTQQILSARTNLQSLKKIVHYLGESECLTDNEGKTLVHLGVLNNNNAVTKATEAVNHYYFHTLENPSHRSTNFWNNFVEYFGVHVGSNLLPYTSSNTASSHNVEHQECVNNLLHNLEPLSNCVNLFFKEYYEQLYTKQKNLLWGPFAPRSFGIFPTIAINYNTISDFHWDDNDNPNSLCCLVALGDFEGGELCFPQLQIVVPLQPGQVVVFSSRLLLHGNFPVLKGIRYSIVYFIHSGFFHHLRDFSSVRKDLKNNIEKDSRGNIVLKIPRQDLNNANEAVNPNTQISLNTPTLEQIKIPLQSNINQRRKHIGE